MRQRPFEERGRARWEAFEKTLADLEADRRGPASDFPARYRRICQDLALARDRQFSGTLIERLNRMALAGHHHLYRTRPGGWQPISRFASIDFPRAVRAEWRLVLLNSALFCGLAGLLAALVLQHGELVYSFVSPDQLAGIETMYDPDAETALDLGATPRTNMFGYYIWNNVSIALRTFASGLAFGLGTLAIVSFNGVYVGVIAGHLTRIGFSEPFYTFVIAHSSFELTAIVLAGVAGMRLGLALLAPGDRSRGQSLRDSARGALSIVYGAGGMLLIAAGIEAFWSPLNLAPELKYAVGAGLWGLVILYFLAAGRPRAT